MMNGWVEHHSNALINVQAIRNFLIQMNFMPCFDCIHAKKKCQHKQNETQLPCKSLKLFMTQFLAGKNIFMMDTNSKCLWNFIKHVGNISGIVDTTSTRTTTC